MNSSGIEYWIWFAALRTLRYQTRRALLDRFGTAKEIYFADGEALKLLEGITQAEINVLLGDHSLHEATRIMDRCAELDVHILTMQDAAYPERLRNINDPPYVLYVKGHLPAIDTEPVITIVGTRKSTPYGDKMARNIAFEVASKGGIVTTGLAGGIDSRAAEGALMAGGKVIGVLGVAINEVYPAYNQRLYDDVAASGALVSEYPPDAHGSKEWFPQRNRIMAGLSLATVVCEAPVRSGALITANRALDYGRDLFVVPGNADAPNCRGSNNLLREKACAIAENGWDVLREYEAQFPDKINPKGKGSIPEELAIPEQTNHSEKEEAKKPGRGFLKLRVPNRKKQVEETAPVSGKLEAQLSDLTETQLKIVGAMEKPNMHIDDIIDVSGLPASAVLSELTILQIKGFVKQETGKRFTLNISK